MSYICSYLEKKQISSKRKIGLKKWCRESFQIKPFYSILFYYNVDKEDILGQES